MEVGSGASDVADFEEVFGLEADFVFFFLCFDPLGSRASIVCSTGAGAPSWRAISLSTDLTGVAPMVTSNAAIGSAYDFRRTMMESQASIKFVEQYLCLRWTCFRVIN